MARLSIRVVNMAKMFSRIDTSSSSENVVVVVKIPLYFAIKSDDAQGVIRLNTHESNAHNLARGMTMTVYFGVEQTLAPSLSSSSLNEWRMNEFYLCRCEKLPFFCELLIFVICLWFPTHPWIEIRHFFSPPFQSSWALKWRKGEGSVSDTTQSPNRRTRPPRRLRFLPRCHHPRSQLLHLPHRPHHQHQRDGKRAAVRKVDDTKKRRERRSPKRRKRRKATWIQENDVESGEKKQTQN